jgi:hypothetical protein
MRKHWSLWVLAGLSVLCALLTQTAAAQERTVTLTANNVTSHTTTDATLGAYYTVAFEVPSIPEGARLDHAVLEVYLDVASKARDEYVNDTPVLEVFALRNDFDGDLNPANWDAATRATRPLLLGEEKYVVMDVTGIIRSLLVDPSKNHGLVIGSLTGMREGDFTVRTGLFPDSGLLRLRLYFEPEFAPRTKE